MADQLPPDVQAVLAAARARQAAPRPVVVSPPGGFNPNVVLPDSPDYTLSNAQKGGSIAHEQVSTAAEAAKAQSDALARSAQGGITTDAEERRAAGVAVQLLRSLSTMHDIYKKDPTLLQPSYGEEAFAQHLGPLAPGETPFQQQLTARTYYLNHYEPARAEDRLEAYKSFKGALEAAAHVAGARYSPEEGIVNLGIYGITPADTPKEIGNTFGNWNNLASRAIVQSGAGKLMFDKYALPPEAMDYYKNIQGIPATLAQQHYLPNGQAEAPNNQTSTTEQAGKWPDGLQQEHAAFLASIPRGKLTPEMYVDMRNALQQKYLPGSAQPLDPSNPEVQKFVEGFNDPSNHITTRIPDPIRTLTPQEQYSAVEGSKPLPTFLRNYADSATADISHLLETDKQKEAGQLANEANPTASTTGSLAGQITGILGGDKLISAGLGKAAEVGGAVLPKLLYDPAKRAVIADVAANAGHGSLTTADNGGSLGDIAASGGIGALGAVGGRFAVRGAQGFMGEKQLADLAQLKGVDLTTPQAIGAGRLEEMLLDVPIVRGARENAEGSYNLNNNERTLALANEGLPSPQVDATMPPGTEPGTAGNAIMRDRLDQAYDNLLPNISGTRDNTFGLGMVGKEQDIAQMGRKPFSYYVQNVRPLEGTLLDQNGGYTGASYKATRGQLGGVEDQLRSLADSSLNMDNRVMTPQQAREMLGHVGDIKQHLQDMIVRQNPVEGPQLQALDRAYARSQVVYDATNRAGSNPDNLNSPTQYDASIRKMDNSPNKVNSATGRAFDQAYAEAGQRIMGQKAAPSSLNFWKTAGVLGLPHLLAAGAEASGHQGAALGLETLLGVPAMAALYAPGARQVTRALLSKGIGIAPDAVNAPPIAKDVMAQLVAALIANKLGDK